jgi:hypothetical protein
MKDVARFAVGLDSTVDRLREEWTKSMTAVAKGWAIRREGKIDIKTVSESRRAALVNILHLNIHPIFAGASDEAIEELWQKTYQERGWAVVEVTIIEGSLH